MEFISDSSGTIYYICYHYFFSLIIDVKKIQ